MLGLVPSLAIAGLAVWFAPGFRADIGTALVTPVSSVRILLTAILGIAATRLALLLARPEVGQSARLWLLAAVVAAALGLSLWAQVTTPEDARQMATVGKTISTCLVAIPLLSVLPIATLLYTLRQGATTAPARAGFAASLEESCLSASIYALYCTEYSPLFLRHLIRSCDNRGYAGLDPDRRPHLAPVGASAGFEPVYRLLRPAFLDAVAAVVQRKF